MNIIDQTHWIIMSKDRKYIAVGTPRNREIILLEKYNGKRVLTYKSKGMAESAFKNHGFYGVRGVELEAVEVNVKYTEVKL